MVLEKLDNQQLISLFCLHARTPYTGFEPASLLQPTVFKTAPSPPGHIAYGVVYAIRTHTSENLMEGLAIL